MKTSVIVGLSVLSAFIFFIGFAILTSHMSIGYSYGYDDEVLVLQHLVLYFN